MSLGERLIKLRKKAGLSQEEVADKLNVTRQTVSKWETDASLPDFDKIIPLCNLYKIESNELLTGNKIEKESVETLNEEKDNKSKKVLILSISIFLYFIAVTLLITGIAAFKMNPIIVFGIFLLICGLSTCMIIYSSIMYKKQNKPKEITKEDKVYKQIDEILSIITVIIYLIISFATMAWNITWIIFIIYALVSRIVKLIFVLKGDNNEE